MENPYLQAAESQAPATSTQEATPSATELLDAYRQQLSAEAWYEMVWNPVKYLHEGWWDYLKLGWLKAAWSANPDQLVALVNRAVILQCGFPHMPLPEDISDARYRLLKLQAKFDAILVGIGLQAMGQQKYLVDKSHRAKLLQCVTKPFLQRILSNQRLRPSIEFIEPFEGDSEQLVDWLQRIGAQLMHRCARYELGWKILMIRYPPPETKLLSRVSFEKCGWLNWSYLSKMESFLA